MFTFPASSESPLRRSVIHHATHSSEFARAVQVAHKQISSFASPEVNEKTLEGVFERTVHAILRDIGLEFHPLKETPPDSIRHVFHGRTDSRFGAVILEFKRPGWLSATSNTESAVKQLSQYVELQSESSGKQSVGFLLDGYDIVEVHGTAGEIVKVTAVETFTPASLRRIVNAFITNTSTALTPENLILDFCGSNQQGAIFQTAQTLFRALTADSSPKTQMLFEEWKRLFRLSHDDSSQQKKILDRRNALSLVVESPLSDNQEEYAALFALHTSYSIVLKWVAYRVVCDIRLGFAPIQFESLLGGNSADRQLHSSLMESGDEFKQLGFANLVEGDFYSWYSTADQWSQEIDDCVKSVLQILARYEDVANIFQSEKVPDLFHRLYNASVPQSVRSSFGEFYTPLWLAEQLVTDIQADVSARFLDPCCGSGAFVVAAISYIRDHQPKGSSIDGSLANEILESVVGIDLNPLAVLTARINYLIRIADLLEDRDQDIIIPIFFGDSTNVPLVISIDGVECVVFALETEIFEIPVTIPVEAAQDHLELVRWLDGFESFVVEGHHEEAISHLLARVGDLSDKPNLKGALEDFASAVIQLEEADWNGIWSRIAANYVAGALIGKFDAVIGNPPWIDWKSLPSGYRERVKNLCIDRGLFSGAGRTGGNSLNICALITHVAATRWLGDSGTLAFLMPRELIFQSSYEGWRRNVGGRQLNLSRLIDWSNAGHPFDPVKAKFLTYVFGRSAWPAKIIPLTMYSKRTSSNTSATTWSSWDTATNQLERTDLVAGSVIPQKSSLTVGASLEHLSYLAKVPGAFSYVGREGIELYPQEAVVLEYLSDGPSGSVWVQNVQIGKSKHKVPRRRFLVETDYLFPMLKSPMVSRFGHESPQYYVLFPYTADDPHNPISPSVLAKRTPRLWKYLTQIQGVLESQTDYSDSLKSNDLFYGYARIGRYSFRDHFVAFRDNTNWGACVVQPVQTPWGETKRFICQNHVVAISERSDGSFIDREDELHFIVGIMNAPLAVEFINASSDSRSFKIRPEISCPAFDPTNADHIEIATLAREASVQGVNQTQLEALNRAYARLLEPSS